MSTHFTARNLAWSAGLMGAIALVATAMAGPASMVLPVAGHVAPPRADVPGFPGSQWNNVLRFYGSSGDYWCASPSMTGMTTTTDQVVIIGQGANFSIVARESETVVDGSGTILNLGGTLPPMVNKFGEWALNFAPLPAGSPQMIIKHTSSGYSTVATVGGAAGAALPAGSSWGASFAWAGISDAGDVSFENDNFFDPTAAGGLRGNFKNNGNTLVSRTFATIPANQFGGTAAQLSSTNFGGLAVPGFQSSADGLHSVYLGDLDGVTPSQARVVVFDGAVVLQAGTALPGSADTINTITEAALCGNGDWFASCTAGSPSQRCIVRSGVVIARVSQSITPGSGETWTAITDYKGNYKGQWIVTGTTAGSPQPWQQQAAVLNSSTVIARSGDPVSLDPDGLFDDGIYIHNFRDRGFLGNDGYYYGAVLMRTSETGATQINANSSLIRIKLPSLPCQPADIADDTGAPLPSSGSNTGVNEGDYNAFFQGFFDALSYCDIADDAGNTPPTGTNTGVNEGDYNGFFQNFFNGCP